MKRACVRFGLFGVMAIAALMVISISASMQEKGIKPTATPVKVFAIPAAAFNSEYSTFGGDSWSYHWYVNEKLYITTSSTDNGIFYAPIILPNWSKITKIEMYCIDNGGDTIKLKLRSSPHSGDFAILEAKVQSSGADSSLRKFSASTGIRVKNKERQYVLRLVMPTSNPIVYYFKCALIYYSDAQW